MDDVYFSVNLVDIKVEDDLEKKPCYYIKDISSGNRINVCGKAGKHSSPQEEKDDWIE